MNNEGGANGFFGIKVSQPGIDVNSASNNQLIMQDNYDTRIYYSSTGVPNVLLGLRSANVNNQLATNEQGLFVAQSGIDVTQATDQQMIFNTNNTFRVVLEGSVTITETLTFTGTSGTFGAFGGTGNNLLATIPHSLSYIPYVLGGTGIEDAFQALPAPITMVSAGSPIWGAYTISADATNIYISFDAIMVYFSGTTSVTFSVEQIFTYYLIQIPVTQSLIAL